MSPGKDKPLGSSELAKSELMTVRKLAIYLNCSQKTVLCLASRGELPCSRVGNNWQFLRSEIDKWLAQVEARHSQSAPRHGRRHRGSKG